MNAITTSKPVVAKPASNDLFRALCRSCTSLKELAEKANMTEKKAGAKRSALRSKMKDAGVPEEKINQIIPQFARGRETDNSWLEAIKSQDISELVAGDADLLAALEASEGNESDSE